MFCIILYVQDRCAYQPEQRKFPLHVVLEVGHVGRTSFSVISTVTLSSGDVMLTAVNQVSLLVDAKTRYGCGCNCVDADV